MQHFPMFLSAPKRCSAEADVASEEVDIDDNVARAIRLHLRQMLASQHFVKAQRMSRLITYLIEAELMGDTARLCEYAVGIDVFDRDARCYSTCEDPIVRVQMGRLRERLANYYAQTGAASSYRFSVPLGSYRPVIERMSPRPEAQNGALLLSVVPLVNCNPGQEAAAFAQGLNEELAYRLFRTFARRIVPNHFAQGQASTGNAANITHVLEGSVRIAASGARVSVRVIEVAAGCVCWSEQFDRDGPCDLAAQEALSGTACSALRAFFLNAGLIGPAHDACQSGQLLSLCS